MQKNKKIFVGSLVVLVLLLAFIVGYKITAMRIVDNKQSLNEQGTVSYIPNEYIEQGVQQKVLMYKDNLLVFGTDNIDGKSVLELAILSLKAGEVLYKTELSGIDIPDVQICGEKITVTDWSDGDVRVLDDKLQLAKEYKAEADSCGIYLNPDVTKVYCFTKENGVRIVDMETGEVKVLLENAKNLFVSNKCGEAVSITYTDNMTQLDTCTVIDLKEGAVKEIPFTGTFYNVEYSDDIWLAGISSADSTYYLGNVEHSSLFMISDENGLVSMLNNPTRLLLTSYNPNGISTMKLYGIDGNLLVEAQFAIEGSGVSYDPVWSEEDNGYFFTVTDESGKDLLLFLDLEKTVDVEG